MTGFFIDRKKDVAMSGPRLMLTSLVSGLLMLPSLAAVAAGKCDRLVVTGSPDAPPYLWRDPQDPKHLMGASADLLKEGATQMGVKIELLFAGKRSQALEEVRSGRMDMLADTPLNASELESLDFIHPPIAQNEIMVWTRVGHVQPFNALADLHGHPGAISEKTRVSTAFDNAIKEHLTVEKQPNLTQAFQKLMLGQVEFVLAGRYAGMALAQTLGMDKDLLVQPLPLDRPGLYLAFSFNSACNDSCLREQLEKKMTELAASSRSSAAVTRNLELWKAQLQQPTSATHQ